MTAAMLKTTIENAELEGIQTSPSGECFTMYRIGKREFLYTPSLDTAVLALRNGLCITPMHKHHTRGWEPID